MGNGQKKLGKQRKRLWLKDRHCYYCRVETILSPERVNGQIVPREIKERLATIDHVRPRHHPARGMQPEPGEQLRVLACWKCNNQRDSWETKSLPRDYLWQKCGSVPLSQRSTEELQKVLKIVKAKQPRGKANRLAVERSIEAIEAELEARQEV